MCVARYYSGAVVKPVLSNLWKDTAGLGYVATHIKVSNLLV